MDERNQPIPTVWRKSSYSEAGSCIEVAHTDETVFVRDSKDRRRLPLFVSKLVWAAFLADIRSGKFDD
jgi:hypothetical protein